MLRLTCTRISHAPEFLMGVDNNPVKRILACEQGIALFIVLWVLTLLSVIVGEFCFAMRTEVNITRNFKEQTQGYYIALAGLNRAIGELIRNEVIPRQVNIPENQEQEEQEAPRWRVNVDIPPVPFAGGQFTVKMGNESGKININQADRAFLKMILKGLDLEAADEDIIVDSILDWRDKDNLHRINGAEDDYYESLPEPYECKDGDFDTVEELLMVRGITPAIFYGGLKHMVTVYPQKKASQRSRRYRTSTNKININAASMDMLLALPSMTEDLAQRIVDYRKESDFLSMDQVESVVGSDVFHAILPFITLKTGPYYTIVSVGKLSQSNGMQGVEALVEIDPVLKKGFRMIQWRDRLERAEEGLKKMNVQHRTSNIER